MSEVQTLEAGLSPSQKYGSYGTSSSEQPDLESMFILVIAKKQAGKTSLFLDNEAALIINADGSSAPISSATSPVPKAQFWPGRNRAGQFVDPQGKPMVISGAKIMELKDRLIDAAVNNKPRPRQLVFDSITTMIGLFKDYILEQSVSLGITKDTKENWKNMDGRSAYDVLYDILISISVELWQHGYGVVWVVHLSEVHDKILLADGRELTRDRSVLSISESLLRRASPYFELIIHMEKKREESTDNTPEVREINGKKVNIPRSKSVSRDVRVLYFKGDPASSEPQFALPASRVPMPDKLVISSEGRSWQELKSVYDQAKETTK
jgi:hypothetical protein